MSWDRKQFRGQKKYPRHARVPLCVAQCEDCGGKLSATHQVSRFGGRCRSCWQAVYGVMGEVISGA